MSDAEIDTLAHAVFDTMFEDVVLGIALDEHKAGMRNRAVCAVCHTRCRLEEHINQGASSGLPGTPVLPAAGASGAANGNGAKQEPVTLDCVKCKRPFGPSRYANHLATCLGLGSGRRQGPRNATSKGRAGAEPGAGPPIQRSGSANGVLSEDQTTAPTTAKPKASKKKKKADAPESTNGNNKREGAAPAKATKAKKQKVGKGANGKPLAFQPADLEESTIPSVPSPSPSKTSTVTRVPSKLQNSQTPISPAGSSSTTPTHTPQMPPAPAPPRVVRGTGPPRPLLNRGPSVPRTSGVVIDKPPPAPPTRQSSTSHSRTEADGDMDDLVDTASDSSDDT